MRIHIWTSDSDTGGPWALQQLAQSLRTLGADVDLKHPAYLPSGTPKERAAALREGMDPGDVVVCPEIWAPGLLAVEGVRRVLWWLSVDNAYPPPAAVRDEAFDRTRSRLLFDARMSLAARPQRAALKQVPEAELLHAVQSEYARRHVARRLRRTPLMLTDYLTDGLDQVVEDRPEPRERTVAFNPSKGLPATRRAQRLAGGDYEFLPVTGLSREATISLLRRAAVYLDLGAHPGRDRLPREAAMCGCVVVVGDRGAARNDVDIPVPLTYKTRTPTVAGGAGAVLRTVERVLQDWPAHHAQMRPYRDAIRRQRAEFDEQVRRLLERLS